MATFFAQGFGLGSTAENQRFADESQAKRDQYAGQREADLHKFLTWVKATMGDPQSNTPPNPYLAATMVGQPSLTGNYSYGANPPSPTLATGSQAPVVTQNPAPGYGQPSSQVLQALSQPLPTFNPNTKLSLKPQSGSGLLGP